MQSHYRPGLHRRDEECYEDEGYDHYEEEGSEEEEDEEREKPVNSKEQQEFLSLREKLKEKFRKKLKKQTASTFGRQSLVNKKPVADDRFGSFFGPSKPVIASRVLDERRSIQEISHIASHVPRSKPGNKVETTSSKEKAHVQYPQAKAKVVNEVKTKAQALKNTRDYSFLLSDDADLPVPNKEEQRQPAAHKPVPNSDGRSAQFSSKFKAPTGKPMHASSESNGRGSKSSSSKDVQSKHRVGPAKGADMSRPRPISAENRKVGGSDSKGSNRQIVNKPLSSNSAKANSLPSKTLNDPRKNVPSTLPRPSLQRDCYSEQRRPSERPRPPAQKSSYSEQRRPSERPRSPVQKSSYSEQRRPSERPRPPVQKSSYSEQRRPSERPRPTGQKSSYCEQRRPSERPNNVRPAPRQSLPSPRPQMKPSHKFPVRNGHEVQLKKKAVKRRHDEEEDEDAIQMIRNMFRYNPNKYVGDDEDVSDMEADFRTIQKEERMSSKIAKKEDEEQLLLIEEEERLERMRKKQKLSRR